MKIATNYANIPSGTLRRRRRRNLMSLWACHFDVSLWACHNGILVSKAEIHGFNAKRCNNNYSQGHNKNEFNMFYIFIIRLFLEISTSTPGRKKHNNNKIKLRVRRAGSLHPMVSLLSYNSNCSSLRSSNYQLYDNRSTIGWFQSFNLVKTMGRKNSRKEVLLCANQ